MTKEHKIQVHRSYYSNPNEHKHMLQTKNSAITHADYKYESQIPVSQGKQNKHKAGRSGHKG